MNKFICIFYNLLRKIKDQIKFKDDINYNKKLFSSSKLLDKFSTNLLLCGFRTRGHNLINLYIKSIIRK